MKSKGLGFYFAVLSAVLGLVGLVIFLVYTGQGGKMDAMVIAATVIAVACCASLLPGEKAWTDFTGIVAAALMALAMILTLQGGIGNIADQINSIVMFGDANLANLNYFMAIAYGLATVMAICACFTRKSR